MATDPPGVPSMTLVQSSRTLTSVLLNFIPGNSGGSPIIGYILYRDQGVSGSPYTLIYNGTGKPELIQYNVTGLTTGQTYSFKLYSMNIIY